MLNYILSSKKSSIKISIRYSLTIFVRYFAQKSSRHKEKTGDKRRLFCGKRRGLVQATQILGQHFDIFVGQLPGDILHHAIQIIGTLTATKLL